MSDVPLPENSSSRQSSECLSTTDTSEQTLRAIAYSIDALVPGIYLWCGPLKIRLGGSLPEENYPGTIHSNIGAALVLPGYRSYSTY